MAGSGVHGDLNSHIIDLARYLVGEFDEVVGMQETFIKKRPKLKETEKLIFELTTEASEKMGEVTNDDTAFFLARFANGALGTFGATRVDPGRKALALSMEISGSKGDLFFNAEGMNKLWFYSSEDMSTTRGCRKILVTESTHPYMDVWQSVAGIIAYEHLVVHLVYDFMKAIDQGEGPSPSFVDGVECQRVLQAVEKSIEERRWIKVK